MSNAIYGKLIGIERFSKVAKLIIHQKEKNYKNEIIEQRFIVNAWLDQLEHIQENMYVVVTDYDITAVERTRKDGGTFWAQTIMAKKILVLAPPRETMEQRPVYTAQPPTLNPLQQTIDKTGNDDDIPF